MDEVNLYIFVNKNLSLRHHFKSNKYISRVHSNFSESLFNQLVIYFIIKREKEMFFFKNKSLKYFDSTQKSFLILKYLGKIKYFYKLIKKSSKLFSG